MTSKTYTMTSIALMAAVICVVGPFTLPIGPVPITLAPLAILLGVYILGTKKETLALRCRVGFQKSIAQDAPF